MILSPGTPAFPYDLFPPQRNLIPKLHADPFPNRPHQQFNLFHLPSHELLVDDSPPMPEMWSGTKPLTPPVEIPTSI